MKDLVVDEQILLELSEINKFVRHGLDLYESEQSLVEGSCACDNKSPGSKKGGEFLERGSKADNGSGEGFSCPQATTITYQNTSRLTTGLCQQVLTLTSSWGRLGNALCGGGTEYV